MSGDDYSNEILYTFMHTFLRYISKKRSPEIQNLSLLRNTASSALWATRSIFIQLHYPRIESTEFLSFSISPTRRDFLRLFLLVHFKIGNQWKMI